MAIKFEKDLHKIMRTKLHLKIFKKSKRNINKYSLEMLSPESNARMATEALVNIQII